MGDDSSGTCLLELEEKLHCDDDASDTLKIYQVRARGLLKEYLDRTYGVERIKNSGNVEQNMACSKSAEDDTGFRLFRCAPPGVSFKCSGREVVSRKRARKLRDNDCDESSKMFESRLLAAAIDGATVKARAEKAITKLFCSWLSKEAAEKEAHRIEEERVSLLKQQRGEEWLPSVARKMAMDRFSDAALNASRKDVKVHKFNNEYRSEDLVKLSSQLKTPGQSESSTKNDCRKGKKGKVKKQNTKEIKAGSANE